MPKFKWYVWVVFVVFSLLAALIKHPPQSAAFFGFSVGILFAPIIIIAVIWGVGAIFKKEPSQSTVNTVYVVFWCIYFLGSFGQPSSRKNREDIVKQQLIDTCVYGAGKADSSVRKIIDLRKYCECAMEKLMKEKGDEKQMIQDLKNPSSVLFNEKIRPCLEEARLIKTGNIGSLLGSPEADTVALFEGPGVSQVKVKAGKHWYYFIFDSGASDIMISKSVEKDLAKSGAVFSYIDTLPYRMANGDIIECPRILAGPVEIGAYTVDTAVMAVYNVEGEEIECLLGKSFMNKFSSWTISNDKSHLILRK